MTFVKACIIAAIIALVWVLATQTHAAHKAEPLPRWPLGFPITTRVT
jgi:hypothetical protein